ncbi:serine/threonine protein kinase [Novisyntrophococcus fermenticellae]|uniref:serine/threonine protein kinase n=1 Tax=Novisyntrophococcus fermenticellae TaxID=2068655 RepID=UPI001E56F675|nr:serine/threonine-protein kinase [Novisyntrophococcus fermenticellae]
MLIESIGKGGFGEVYLSVDIHLGKEWAVKRLLCQDDNGIHEAVMMRELDFQTLPRIVDFIKEEDGLYIVMDYLKGKSLGGLLCSGKKFNQQEVLEIGIRLAETLEYLHGRNPPVLYQDMKPDNILLTDDGQVKLIDFGVAAWMQESYSSKIHGGTRGYAAPEQYGGVCDQTTDIYGLGRTLKILSGGQGARGFRRIIRRCTRKRKEQRYQSAEKVHECLEKIYENKRQNQRMIVWLLGGLGVLLAAGMVFMLIDETKQHRYYTIMKEAATAIENTESSEKIVELYKSAIELNPEKEDPYLKFLDICLVTGQTQVAADWLEYMWEICPSETFNHTKTKEKLAILYFCGNSLDPDFNRNSDKACRIFQELSIPSQNAGKNQDKQNGWKQLYELARSLEEFGSEINWKKVREALEFLKNYGGRMFEKQYSEYACELYLVCGNIYLTEAAYLEDGEVNPYKEAIQCYEKVKEFAELSDTNMGLKQEVLERLASACYLTGVLELRVDIREVNTDKQEESQRILEKSIIYGNQLLKITGNKELKHRILLREASARRFQGKKEDARQCYEFLYKEYPEHIDGLCAYVEFLLENQEEGYAREIMENAAVLPETEKNKNYQILKERLEMLK